VYLRKTDSDRVYQDYFEIAGMYAEYRVIRIWEVPVAELMQYPGLLPFAALGKTDNPDRAFGSIGLFCGSGNWTAHCASWVVMGQTYH
jgi:hypothetical protein